MNAHKMKILALREIEFSNQSNDVTACIKWFRVFRNVIPTLLRQKQI
jgi:hypothetical protein